MAGEVDLLPVGVGYLGCWEAYGTCDSVASEASVDSADDYDCVASSGSGCGSVKTWEIDYLAAVD